jgi:hypothetical protein
MPLTRRTTGIKRPKRKDQGFLRVVDTIKGYGVTGCNKDSPRFPIYTFVQIKATMRPLMKRMERFKKIPNQDHGFQHNVTSLGNAQSTMDGKESGFWKLN